MNKTLVLYHADCSDGFCAAWSAWKALGDRADYIPVQYGQEPPDVAGKDVYVVDFSYKRGPMLIMASQAASLTVLDHHKTARDELDGLEDECSRGFGVAAPTVVFDMGKSGGRLAWEHFHPGKMAHWLVSYTEDRDLWRWQLPRSREINAGLSSYPRTFERWDEFDAYGAGGAMLGRLATEGAAILRYQDQLVESICKAAREVEIGGHRVLAANTSALISEVAGKLAEGRPFGAAWFVRSDGKRQWSLRSRDGGVDVSEVARARGGGGHRNAAGFEDDAVEGRFEAHGAGE